MRDRSPSMRKVHHAHARFVVPGLRHLDRPGGIDVAPGKTGQTANQPAHVVRSAGPEVAEQRGKLVLRQRRGLGQSRLCVAVLARQQGELDSTFARQRGQAVAAVAPPVVAAEKAHEDDLGVAGNAVHPQIHRHGMAQVAQAREPHRRQRAALFLPGRSQTCQIAVCEGQRQNVGRLLPQVDRLGDIVERRRSGGQDVHDLTLPAFPFSPPVFFRSPACPGLSGRSPPASSGARPRPSRPGRNSGSRAGRPPAAEAASACRRPRRIP